MLHSNYNYLVLKQILKMGNTMCAACLSNVGKMILHLGAHWVNPTILYDFALEVN